MNKPQTVGIRAMLYETQALLFEIHRSLAKLATREGEIRMLLDQMMHNTLSQIATVDGSVREEAPQMISIHAEHINLANATIRARGLKPGAIEIDGGRSLIQGLQPCGGLMGLSEGLGLQLCGGAGGSKSRKSGGLYGV